MILRALPAAPTARFLSGQGETPCPYLAAPSSSLLGRCHCSRDYGLGLPVSLPSMQEATGTHHAPSSAVRRDNETFTLHAAQACFPSFSSTRRGAAMDGAGRELGTPAASSVGAALPHRNRSKDKQPIAMCMFRAAARTISLFCYLAVMLAILHRRPLCFKRSRFLSSFASASEQQAVVQDGLSRTNSGEHDHDAGLRMVSPGQRRHLCMLC